VKKPEGTGRTTCKLVREVHEPSRLYLLLPQVLSGNNVALIFVSYRYSTAG
jgi:hypothetical protein